MRIILTDVGEQLASEGFLTGVFPKITKVWFGDGNGSEVIPNTSMTSLTNMIYEGVGTVIARFNTPNRLYIYTQIPASVGDITVREIGLLTEDNTLIAIGGELEKYKPPISESVEKMDFYITLPISSTQEITVGFSNDNLYAPQGAIDVIANAEEANRVAIQDIILNKMPTKVNYTDVVNTLTSTLTNRPLSALQGKVLKGMIDNINALLLSDNTTLDSMQEVVDFIEANRNTLNTLSIPNIAGLENALNNKIKYSDINNTLISTDTNKPLSAAQGKILKGYIDQINTLLLSDVSNLDTLQEIVDFIELNRETLNTLGISNIAGLQNALNGKLSTTGTAADSAKLIGKNWSWSGQDGQPNWLWGGTDGANMYVYNPSNFNVNYANSAGVANSISAAVAGNANAGLGIGSVGSYAFLTLGTSGGQIVAGSLYSGSSLFYSGVAEDEYNHGQAYDYLWKGNGTTGTWRAMGDSQNSGRYEATLFLRIA